MISNLLELNICDNESILRGFGFLRILITIAKILVPIIIIGVTSIDLGKAVISSKDDEIKSVTSKLPRRLIAGLIIFFIPTIVNYIFDTFVKYQDTANAFTSCSVCLTNESECEDLIVTTHQEFQKNKKDLSTLYTIDIDIAELDREGKKAREERRRKQAQEGKPSTPGASKSKVNANGQYFDSNNVTKISGLTEAELTEIIQNSTAYNGKAKVYLPLVKDLIAAEKNHGVNAFYLMGVYSLESGWLSSALAKDCNNLGGVRFYSSKVVNGHSTSNCSGHSGWTAYQNRSDFIEYHATLLETKYLTPGADHYYGTSVAAVATDYGHSNGVDSIIRIAANISGSNVS